MATLIDETLTLKTSILDTPYAIGQLNDGRYVCTCGGEIIDISWDTSKTMGIERYFTKETLFLWPGTDYIAIRTKVDSKEVIFKFDPKNGMQQIN